MGWAEVRQRRNTKAGRHHRETLAARLAAEGQCGNVLVDTRQRNLSQLISRTATLFWDLPAAKHRLFVLSEEGGYCLVRRMGTRCGVGGVRRLMGGGGGGRGAGNGRGLGLRAGGFARRGRKAGPVAGAKFSLRGRGRARGEDFRPGRGAVV